MKKLIKDQKEQQELINGRAKYKKGDLVNTTKYRNPVQIKDVFEAAMPGDPDNIELYYGGHFMEIFKEEDIVGKEESGNYLDPFLNAFNREVG